MKTKITLLLLLFSLNIQAQISNLLIASYNFDSNLIDTSSNAWNGTATGSPAYGTDRFGNPLKCIKIDGFDDKVTFGNLPLHGNFSISLWLNAPSSGVNSNIQSIISKRATCNVSNFFDVRGLSSTNPTSVNIEVRDASNRGGHGGGAEITKNEWVHVVYVLDSLSRITKTYIDGAKVSERAWDANFKTITNTASFGIANSPCTGVPYVGSMDDLRVYYGPLDAASVKLLYAENGFCKAVGGTLSLSGNKILDSAPTGTFIGKITKSKPADVWLFPADSADNVFFTYRNDSLFSNNLVKSSSKVLFLLDNCEKKTQSFNISRGNKEIFLISKYTFSGNLNDESGNGWNGTYTGSTTPLVTGVKNETNGAIALTNTSSNYFKLGDQPWDNANLSISFWMKPNAVSTNSMVFSKRSTCGVGNFIDVRYNTDGTLGAEILSSNSGTAHVGSTSNTLLPINQWHHVVIVLDNVKKKSFMYVNGTLANTTSWTNFTGLDNSAPFAPGYSPCAVNGFKAFDGTLDEILVYGTPLSQNDVTSLYNSVVTGLSNPNSELSKLVYPNPANDHIIVNEFSEVYDMIGNKVAEGSGNISLSHLNKGIYLVKIGSQFSKLVKE